MIVKLIHCGNKSIVNSNNQAEKNTFFMPMGIFALAHHLQKSNIDVEIIHSDLEYKKPFEDIIDLTHIDAIGFDCHWVNQSLAVLETAHAIKERSPNTYIFLGGFSASLFAAEIMEQHPYIDAIIRGDAEKPIVTLIHELDQKKDLSAVPNIVWRDDQNIRNNGISYIASNDDLEECEFANLTLLRNWEHYRKRSIYWTHFAPDNFAPFNFSPLFFLEIGRGCTNDCLFCGGSAHAQYTLNKRRGCSHRSVESVIRTIEKAISFGFKTFLSDCEFDGSEAWYIELFRRIEEKRLDICFVYSAWGIPSQKLLDALSSCCTGSFLQLSPETADDALRTKNKRRIGYSNQELEDVLTYCMQKKNIKVQLYFGYFLAHETHVTVLKTLEYLALLTARYSDILEIAYSNYSTDPGSLLYNDPDTYDVDMSVRTFADYHHYLRAIYLDNNVDSPDMRLFKPRSLTEEECVCIENKVLLFNYLFIVYRNSISQILHHTNGVPAIASLIHTVVLDPACFGDESLKIALQQTCTEHGIDDTKLFQVIEEEYEYEKTNNKYVFKAKPNIWIHSV